MQFACRPTIAGDDDLAALADGLARAAADAGWDSAGGARGGEVLRQGPLRHEQGWLRGSRSCWVHLRCEVVRIYFSATPFSCSWVDMVWPDSPRHVSLCCSRSFPQMLSCDFRIFVLHRSSEHERFEHTRLGMGEGLGMECSFYAGPYRGDALVSSLPANGHFLH